MGVIVSERGCGMTAPVGGKSAVLLPSTNRIPVKDAVRPGRWPALVAHDVFISYSSKDKAVADATCARLEQAGVRCWIAPRDITPGIEYGEALINAIRASKVMVVIFSDSAQQSPQVRREVERAVSHGVIIVPLRIEDVLPRGSMEFFLSTPHWLDALTPPLEAHLERLSANLNALLKLDALPPPLPRPQPIPQAQPFEEVAPDDFFSGGKKRSLFSFIKPKDLK